MRVRLSATLILTAAALCACRSPLAQPGSAPGDAQPPGPGVPISAPADLLAEAVEVLSSRPLGRETVDWAAVERELRAALPVEASRQDFHNAIAQAVARLNDPHAGFVPAPPDSAPAADPAPQATADAPSDAASDPAAAAPVGARRVPDRTEGRLLEDGVAYLLVPGCALQAQEPVRAWAEVTASCVRALAGQSPRGWVIDLRLNGGGNLWPMLLGLQPLLGDGALMSAVGSGGIEARYGVEPGAAWIDWGNGAEPQLTSEGVLHADSAAPQEKPHARRIAVLIGPWTMSSGEALALCLRSINGTRLFGEKTAGLTTVTNFFPLSDGSTLILPVSNMGDLEGRTFPDGITPDQPAAWGDWPTHDDEAAQAARNWVLQAP